MVSMTDDTTAGMCSVTDAKDDAAPLTPSQPAVVTDNWAVAPCRPGIIIHRAPESAAAGVLFHLSPTATARRQQLSLGAAAGHAPHVPVIMTPLE